MKLYHITAKDTLRRKRRAMYTALGVAVGVAAVIAVLTVARAGEEKIYGEMEKYGPNLMVMPAINDMELQIGDLRLGSLAVGDNYITSPTIKHEVIPIHLFAGNIGWLIIMGKYLDDSIVMVLCQQPR